MHDFARYISRIFDIPNLEDLKIELRNYHSQTGIALFSLELFVDLLEKSIQKDNYPENKLQEVNKLMLEVKKTISGLKEILNH